jgi:hypothetical protein
MTSYNKYEFIVHFSNDNLKDFNYCFRFFDISLGVRPLFLLLAKFLEKKKKERSIVPWELLVSLNTDKEGTLQVIATGVF